MMKGLTENHARSLTASVQHAANLIRDCEQVLTSAEHPQAFSRYTGPLSPPQLRIARDYLDRLREQLLRFLEAADLPAPEPTIEAVRALSTSMMFLDDAFEEMRPQYLRGYGALTPQAAEALEGLVAELQALVREAAAVFTGAPSEVLRERIRQLPDANPAKRELEELSRIISDYGLVDLRPALALILERATEETFEVAVVGRVSSGKSSLLNALIGSHVLPTGVLPVTAFPTRLRRGPAARLRVTTTSADAHTTSVEEITEFVTEAKNPGNVKRLTRLVVEFPSDRLPEGVTFVDTPGLGSLASSGALQTFAYLPRCDHATFLLDATAPVTEDDLALLAFLRQAEITTSILLSKADLLKAPDLATVREYVSRQVASRTGGKVPVRAISTAPGFESLIEDWIHEEVYPLGRRARGRVHEGMIRKADHLRRQAASALAHRLGAQRGAPLENRGTIAERLREVTAAMEQTNRDLRGIGDNRGQLLETAIVQAAEVYADALQNGGTPPEEQLRAALTRPVQDIAERVARHLADRSRQARQALIVALDETGARRPQQQEPEAVDRGVPVFDLPPVSLDLKPPFWTRVSRAALRVWIRARTKTELQQTLDTALAAYIDVLKRWADETLAHIRRDFDSQSRPLLSWLARSDRAGPAIGDDAEPQALRRDIAWLRQTAARVETAAGARRT
jgi:GTP-binding protein EngB required for normal cell division